MSRRLACGEVVMTRRIWALVAVLMCVVLVAGCSSRMSAKTYLEDNLNKLKSGDLSASAMLSTELKNTKDEKEKAALEKLLKAILTNFEFTVDKVEEKDNKATANVTVKAIDMNKALMAKIMKMAMVENAKMPDLDNPAVIAAMLTEIYSDKTIPKEEKKLVLELTWEKDKWKMDEEKLMTAISGGLGAEDEKDNKDKKGKK